jgi:hypothetical protein
MQYEPAPGLRLHAQACWLCGGALLTSNCTSRCGGHDVDGPGKSGSTGRGCRNRKLCEPAPRRSVDRLGLATGVEENQTRRRVVVGGVIADDARQQRAADGVSDVRADRCDEPLLDWAELGAFCMTQDDE